MDLQSLLALAFRNLMDTSMLEFVAVLFGLLSVWFARKENIWVYPTGIINVTIYVYLCFQSGLYADMGINAFYFAMSVYGWYRWRKKDKTDKTLPISALSKMDWLIYMFITLLFYVILRFVLIYFTDSTVPDFDSFTTAIFIVGMWLMAIKKVENWVFWMVGDALVIPLFAYKGLVFTGFQYLVFLILAVMGWKEWNRRLKEQESI